MKKSERLNQELIFLKDKKSFQLRDLIDGFAISERTALRDIAELEALGVPLYTETGRLGGYRVLSHTLSIPVYFTDEEITAILFALQSLQNLTTTLSTNPTGRFTTSCGPPFRPTSRRNSGTVWPMWPTPASPASLPAPS